MKKILAFISCTMSLSTYAGVAILLPNQEAPVFFTSSMPPAKKGDDGYWGRTLHLICDISNYSDNNGYIYVTANKPNKLADLRVTHYTCTNAGCGYLYGPKVYFFKANTRVDICVAPSHAGIIFNNHSSQSLSISCDMPDATSICL